MINKNIPINKGNYSLDTTEREKEFERKRGLGHEKEYQQNRKEWTEFAKSQYIADYPLLVDIELASLCNLKCPMCYTITKEFKKLVNATLMDFELFKKIVDEIAGKVFAIRLSLRGESTLHPKFVDAIRYAKEKGIKEVSSLTNGSKLKGDYARKVIEAGIDWITFSIDGINETYEKIRKPTKFAQIMSNLEEIKRIKAELNTEKPVIKIQGIWPAIEENPSEYYNKLAPSSDLMAFNPLIDFSYPIPLDQIEYEENFSCAQLYQRLVVGADGKVMMCANDDENQHVIGDANKETIHEIWHGENLNKVREIHKKNDGFKEIAVCQKCYLPRKTKEDIFEINGRALIVKNYV